MAYRVGVIQRGEIILVDEKAALMQKLGQKQLTLQLSESLDQVPTALPAEQTTLSDDGYQLTYTYDAQGDPVAVARLLRQLAELNIDYRDLHTSQSSLEDIFVSLVEERA